MKVPPQLTVPTRLWPVAEKLSDAVRKASDVNLDAWLVPRPGVRPSQSGTGQCITLCWQLYPNDARARGLCIENCL